MSEKRIGYMGGNEITLSGKELQVGDTAPDFLLTDVNMSKKRLSDYAGKLKLISVVPSLDTGVCDAQTRRFNEEALGFSQDSVVLTISMDLPFAQARWCGAAGVDRIITLSDHFDANFGKSYGLLIEELRLENRAVLIIDGDDVVRYIEILKENTEHPDYEAALKAFRELT